MAWTVKPSGVLYAWAMYIWRGEECVLEYENLEENLPYELYVLVPQEPRHSPRFDLSEKQL